MSRKFHLLSKSGLSPAGQISVINEPKISKEINGSFILEFEIDYQERNKLNENILVVADGQYFQIARIVKSRFDTISLSVFCEHVSYEMIIPYELTEELEFESDARTMIEDCLRGTRFSLESCISTEVKYYKTTTLDIRKRLFDISDLFGGELVFDNFNVSLVQRLGSNKGLDIELGINLIGVTEEINFIEQSKGYEIDLVDLSKIKGYERDFSSAELGDTITIIDNKLGINTNERILSIEYNPFQKALPRVSVGDYIRDFTEYLKNEAEEDEEEEDSIASLFKQFKIGGIDMLKKAEDSSSTIVDFLTNKYSQTVEANANYNTLGKELKGIIVERKITAVGVLSVIQTKEINELLVSTITEISTSNQLSNVVINGTESIILVLSEKPLNNYNENSTEVELENIKALGVRITFDNDDSVFLEKFSVGQISLLGMENGNVTEIVKRFVGNRSAVPVAPSEIEIDEILKGIDVMPTEDYLKWHLTLIHSVEGKDKGSWTYTIRDLPIANRADFKVTANKRDSVIVVISNEPFSKILDGTASAELYYCAFGGKFVLGEIVEDITDYIKEFRIGDVNMLLNASDETDQVISYIKGNITEFIPTSIYTTTESLTGLFVELKDENPDYHLTVMDYSNGTFKTIDYSSSLQSWSYPQGEEKTRSVILVVTKEPFSSLSSSNIEGATILAIGLEVEIDEDGDGAGMKEQKMYLEYGTVDLADVMTLTFEKGPYDQIFSVTTGISSSSKINSDITISVETNENGLVAYASNSSANASVNFHVVCMKIEKIRTEKKEKK